MSQHYFATSSEVSNYFNAYLEFSKISVNPWFKYLGLIRKKYFFSTTHTVMLHIKDRNPREGRTDTPLQKWSRKNPSCQEQRHWWLTGAWDTDSQHGGEGRGGAPRPLDRTAGYPGPKERPRGPKTPHTTGAFPSHRLGLQGTQLPSRGLWSRPTCWRAGGKQSEPIKKFQNTLNSLLFREKKK